MNQSAVSDLQKAIEDITKSTNADPVFADTVAAPSKESEPKEVKAAGAPKGAAGPNGGSGASGVSGISGVTGAGAQPIPRPAMPQMGTMPPMPVSAPASAPQAGPVKPVVVPVAPKPAPAPGPMPAQAGPVVAEPVFVSASGAMVTGMSARPSAASDMASSMTSGAMSSATPKEREVIETESFVEKTIKEEKDMNSSADMNQVKAAALRDLAPLLDKMEVAPAQKFGLYRTMVEDLHDASVLPSAYTAASEIADDKERGEALLYLVETIDKM